MGHESRENERNFLRRLTPCETLPAESRSLSSAKDRYNLSNSLNAQVLMSTHDYPSIHPRRYYQEVTSCRRRRRHYCCSDQLNDYQSSLYQWWTETSRRIQASKQWVSWSRRRNSIDSMAITIEKSIDHVVHDWGVFMSNSFLSRSEFCRDSRAIKIVLHLKRFFFLASNEKARAPLYLSHSLFLNGSNRREKLQGHFSRL